MFDGIFYTNTVKRRPLHFPAVVSLALHTAALLVLLIHPEVVFPGKIFERKPEPAPVGASKEYHVVMITSDQPFVAPTRIPQTHVLSDRDQTAKSQPSDPKAPDKVTPASQGDSEVAIEIGQGKRESRRADRAKNASARAQASRKDLEKKGQPRNAGAGQETGRGDTGGDKEPKKTVELAKLLPPVKIEELKSPPPVLPLGPGKDPVIGNNTPGNDPKSTAKDSNAGSARGEGRSGEQDLHYAKNSNSALQSPGNSIIEARGFAPGDEYVRELSQRIQKRLNFSGDLKRLRSRRLMTVSFHIERDGRVSQLKVINPSGDNKFDLMALNAVYNSAPFPPLPKWFPKEYALVEYTPLP